MTVDGRSDRPGIVHHLGAALRFVDAFTGRPVSAPLDVLAETLPVVAGMPTTPWRAVPGPNDGTYRLLVTNRIVMPVGPVPVTVVAPGREYVNFEPFSIALPRAFVAHPPTPDRSDFLVERVLWPTRLLRIPSGETAIVGHVHSAGGLTPIVALRIRIWPSGAPLPATPYAYTDDAGDFSFRLPALKGSVSGGAVASTADLDLDVRLPPAYAVAASIAAPPVPFTVDLGRVTTLQITVP